MGGGAGVSFSLPLSETQGWVKDPENTLLTAYAPTKCEMAQVLSNLSELRILGGKKALFHWEVVTFDRFVSFPRWLLLLVLWSILSSLRSGVPASGDSGLAGVGLRPGKSTGLRCCLTPRIQIEYLLLSLPE